MIDSTNQQFSQSTTIALFLDRDGVINHRIPGAYIKCWDQFEFLDGVLEALNILAPLFYPVVVVTNQQGIGKGLMTAADLGIVHQKMVDEITKSGGRIDAIFYCGDLADKVPNCRKPNSFMAFQAKKKFTQLKFPESIMIGDSLSDLEFGARLGMTTVLIETKLEELEKIAKAVEEGLRINFRFKSLLDFALGRGKYLKEEGSLKD